MALIIIGMTATNASAVECSSPSPKTLPIWQDFKSFVEKEYYQGEKGGGGRRYAFGHALGRLASAVQGQPDRHEAFECVKLVLEREISLLVAMGAPENARVLYSTVMEAAMGMHDEEVAKLTGVTSTEPLYHLFGGKIQQPTSPAKAPVPIVKIQPAPLTKKPGTIIKSQPGVLPPLPSGGSPTSSSTGNIEQCQFGANWKLSTARKAISNAWNLRGRILSDCQGSNWSICQNIMDQLNIARDHIFQTFDQNHDGVNDCKIKCLFDDAAQEAQKLIAWENWLLKRYYPGARGLANIYYTINEHREIPMCKVKLDDKNMQAGVDLPGMDFKSFFLDQSLPALCRNACQNNKRCKAWTFVKPDIQGNKAKCWLKHSVPKSVKDSCCVSGVISIGSKITPVPPLPANAYVIDKIEIPRPTYQTTGSIICDIQISNSSRVNHCKHHKDEGILKVQIQHNFRLRAENGNTFVPGEKVYLEISGSISGHSTGYSTGDYVQARLEPSSGSFKTESKSGDGDGWSLNNSDLPQIGRERRGSASMQLTRVATFPDTKGKPVKIVLTGSNNSSLVTYHLKPVK
ncbi:PAN domain-containing protein [Candidatus Nitrotoga sp. M5]|uniref:PAN domain-containing protein n=1 Tax=Candidatus Nitrotoga sp. M5 TaxID=2890409 RepID=UPI001EF31117|nr:PAN domain-containing protein [Candidatus Nitrotoga sp. M5]